MNEAHLQKLIDAHLENRLTPAEAEELSALLTSSPEAREFFWRHASMHGLLQRAVQLEWLGRAGSDPLGDRSATAPGRRSWLAAPTWVWPSLAAAALVAVAWMAPWARDLRPASISPLVGESIDVEPRTLGVATIARLAGVEWNDPAAAPVAGSVVVPGWLRFKSGLVQLEFFSGASVMILS